MSLLNPVQRKRGFHRLSKRAISPPTGPSPAPNQRVPETLFSVMDAELKARKERERALARELQRRRRADKAVRAQQAAAAPFS